MSDLMKLTLASARDALRAGETTAVELTEVSLAAVAASKPLNAFKYFKNSGDIPAFLTSLFDLT